MKYNPFSLDAYKLFDRTSEIWKIGTCLVAKGMIKWYVANKNE